MRLCSASNMEPLREQKTKRSAKWRTRRDGFSTRLTRARRSQAAPALDPIPASKVQSDPLEIAELDKRNELGG